MSSAGGTGGRWCQWPASDSCRGSQDADGQCMPASKHISHGHILHHGQAAGPEVPTNVCGCMGIHHCSCLHGRGCCSLCRAEGLATAKHNAWASCLLGCGLLCHWLLRCDVGHSVSPSISGKPTCGILLCLYCATTAVAAGLPCFQLLL